MKTATNQHLAILFALMLIGFSCKRETSTGAHNVALPLALQHKVWMPITEIEGNYYQSGKAKDSISTTLDSIFGTYRYGIQSVEATDKGWQLQIKSETDSGTLHFHWVDTARQLATYEYTKGYEEDTEQESDYYATLMEAGQARKLPFRPALYTHGVAYCKQQWQGDKLAKKLTINDIDEFLDNLTNYRVEKSIATDLNKDGIEDIISLSTLIHSTKGSNSFKVYLFLGQADHTYLVYSDHTYKTGPILIENIDAKDGDINIFYIQTGAEQYNHTYSYQYDKKLNDWLLKRIQFADRASKKNKTRKINDPNLTLIKEAVVLPEVW